MFVCQQVACVKPCCYMCDTCAGGPQIEAVLEEMPKWGLVQQVLQVIPLVPSALCHCHAALSC